MAVQDLFPYSLIIGQDQLKLALELIYIMPSGGVLISGRRGTGKSTAVRAFAAMMSAQRGEEQLVTLPINATEDRVVGGWDIYKLMEGKPGETAVKKGLLEEADGKLLYIDEVNLLDDHIVSIILDPAAGGGLSVQHEGRDERLLDVQFKLIGTMNPEEGELRPQLRDRFSLMADIDVDAAMRKEILQAVFDYDRYLQDPDGDSDAHTAVEEAREADAILGEQIDAATQLYGEVKLDDGADIIGLCVKIADAFNADGHRGEQVMLLAARACAALDCAQNGAEPVVTVAHIGVVAPMALQHRRRRSPDEPEAEKLWSLADEEKLQKIIEDWLG